MKKILFGILTITTLLTSCKKDTDNAPAVTGDVTIIVTVNNEPVKDAEVLIYSSVADNGGSAINEEAELKDKQTDSDGLISFTNLLRGSFFVEVNYAADFDNDGVIEPQENIFTQKSFIIKAGEKNEVKVNFVVI